jgi:hypothetical protein
MKTRVAPLTITALVMLVATSAWSADPTESPAAPVVTESSPAPKLVYKPPPNGGRMPIRTSGGARGFSGVDTVLLPLVPEHLALTTQAQPSLFWFQSKPAKAKFELTVVEPKNPKPLVSLTSPDADKVGVHRIKLSRYNVELKPDVLYEWSVAIIPDAENRSQDVIAKGVIKRVNPPPELASQIEKTDGLARAAVYAQAGMWYDALDTITNAIEANPNDASLKEQRASLLKQVGLPQAAALDQKK